MQVILVFLLGVLLWTLTEYIVHRFLGHLAKTRPNPFASEHTMHHSIGDYFAPSWKKAVAASAAFVVVAVPSIALTNQVLGGAFALGFALAYISYEILHRRCHTHAGIGERMRRLRRHHFVHHFRNPHTNFGVTTTLWDKVFGTFAVSNEIRVPHKLAMRWLFDDEDAYQRGIIAQRYTSHYVLIGTLVPT